ncbi:MAG: DUF2306 domain-containing protein [Bacteroidia bacterium]|nr:DUF2306 domain-containing protein [Bacteroidia bacterium]
MQSQKEISLQSASLEAKARKALDRSASVWFLIALAGQWFFALYILGFYGRTSVNGNYESWNEHLFKGIIENDFLGNLFLFMHLILAFMITLGGPLQFFPKFRKKYRAFHRWNGKIYILIALLISLDGLYLILSRGVIGGIGMMGGNMLNASLIMTFSVMAFLTARKKQFADHRKWAIRTFLMVSGVWFFRVGFAFWIFINQGAPGHTENFDGPFDFFLAYGHSLVPLAIAELFFLAERSKQVQAKFSMTALMILLSLITALGIFMATQIFWIPEMG